MIISAILNTASNDVSSEDVIGTCQDAVRKGLRDPDSARFSDWKAHAVAGPAPRGLPYSDGDKVFEATGLVNAKNGFGGYSGDETITCDAVATSEGTIHAQAGPTDLPKP
ncbi:hypothetical protein GR927_20575 [Mycolicibacterium sp. 3033]|nr:hypothetical protein [Mycolicibacterium aurantiacum]